MKKLALWLTALAALIYIGICAAMFSYQRSLLYYPRPARFATPQTTLTLPVDGAELKVSIRPHEGRKALIYFGGNGEDVSQALPSFASTFGDDALYLLHYRGYGGSSGEPSETALHADALVLFDKVRQEHPEIAVIGRSLGTGVAIRLAAERPVARLVLVTPYDSIQNIASGQYPYIPVSWLLTDKFESWRYAPQIKVPTLLLAAENDRLIPRESTERLNAAFGQGIAKLVTIPGVGHDSIVRAPQYLQALRQAVEAH